MRSVSSVVRAICVKNIFCFEKRFTLFAPLSRIVVHSYVTTKIASWRKNGESCRGFAPPLKDIEYPFKMSGFVQNHSIENLNLTGQRCNLPPHTLLCHESSMLPLSRYHLIQYASGNAQTLECASQYYQHESRAIILT